MKGEGAIFRSHYELCKYYSGQTHGKAMYQKNNFKYVPIGTQKLPLAPELTDCAYLNTLVMNDSRDRNYIHQIPR